MELVRNNLKNRFEFICKFEERNIPKSASFRWDSESKRWWTEDKNNASKILNYANDILKNELSKIDEKSKRLLEESHALFLKEDIDIPINEGLSYLQFQKAAIISMSKRNNILLACQMGTGKTIQTIGVINLDQTLNNILIICPASLKLNWKKELQKWLTRDLSISILNSKDEFQNTNIVIINYDITKKFFSELHLKEWDLLICDEVHYMKNPNTQRTKNIVGYVPKKRRFITKEIGIEPIKAKKKIFLTGTPIVNKPVELWPIVNYLDPETWKSYGYFTSRYCAAHHDGWGWNVSGASHLDELQEKLRTSIMIRRLKKDVLKELPAKRRQIIEISSNGSANIVKKEKASLQKYENLCEELEAKIELAKVTEFDEEYLQIVDQLNKDIEVSFSEISKLRHQTAIAKIPYVMEHVLNFLETGEKLVIFCHHHDVVDGISDSLTKNKIQHVIYTGRESREDRDLAVTKFQNESSIQVFLASIQVAGVGITLTAASNVIFAELDWVPGNITQAEDRVHRIGQEDSVLIQHLVLEDSLDANMAHKLIRKQEVIEKALDNLHEIKMPIIPEINKKNDIILQI